MRTTEALLLLLACLSPVAAQEGPTPPDIGEGRPLREVGREGMWPAPTAEDWKKPCLLTFQRTWEDAVAVAKETGRPILVCINMDGEIASEHYAGVRYRQPEIAAIYEPYVCVIASVYRHTPRDHDDQGRRILCPRFGSVTCGEHIAIEPTIFEKFCDGQRVAPRHICVELDGSETYDVFYANDTASVFRAIWNGIAQRDPLPPNVVRSDRPILERVASPDVRDRVAVEAAYAEGDAEARRKLLDAALKTDVDGQLELLRQAIFGLDVDLSRQARGVLTQADTPEATRLVADALRVPMEPAERDALLATLKRLGETSPVARYLAVVHGGLEEGSSVVNPEGWQREAGGTYPAPAPWFRGRGLASQIEAKAEASEAKPDDPAVRLDIAEASLALALRAPNSYSDPRTAHVLSRHLFEEARRSAKQAQELGAEGWRVDAVLALGAYYGGDLEEAYAAAEKAMKSLPEGDGSWSSMAVVTVFAESRWKAIKQAVRNNEPWPGRWLADLHGAYTILLRHPLGTDSQVAWHYDLLDWLGADFRSERLLRAGLERFTTSAPLHERLRDKTLKFRGPEGLEKSYEEMLKEQEDPARIAPFAGAASVVAAEHYRRKGEFENARAAYGRAVAHHEIVVKAYPEWRAGSDVSIALALAGRARVAYELNDDAAALKDILASFGRSPDTAGTRDGMGITPGETGQMLLARLKKNAKAEDAASLEAALAKLDPELLLPDGGE